MTPPKIDEDEKKKQRLAKLAAWKAGALGTAKPEAAQASLPTAAELQPEKAVEQEAWYGFYSSVKRDTLCE